MPDEALRIASNYVDEDEDHPITTQDIVAHTPQSHWWDPELDRAKRAWTGFGDMVRNSQEAMASGQEQFNQRAGDFLHRLTGVQPNPEALGLVTTLMGGVKAPGQPKLWYRGTPHEDRLLNWTDVTPEGLKGTYFTSDPEYAKSYGPVRGYNVNGSIKRVELPDLGQIGSEEWDRIHDAEVTRAHAEGHAGVHLFEPDPANPSAWEEREMILFDPKNAGQPVRIPNPIKAYHGSPHDFNEFDLSKIGTGEGAQAYGHGLYFAESKPVAQMYKESTRKVYDPNSPEGWATYALERSGNDRAMAAALLRDRGAPGVDLLENGFTPDVGRMYEVALHATPEQFLDWDKPLSGQPQAVRDAVAKGFPEALANNPDMTGAGIARGIGRETNPLAESGIPGVRYLDQQSRGMRVGPSTPANDIARQWLEQAGGDRGKAIAMAEQFHRETGQDPAKSDVINALKNWQGPTSNYSVWSPEIIEILRKYGLIPPVAGAVLAGADRDQNSKE